MVDRKYYYKDGTTSNELVEDKILHREDGPAVEYNNGSKIWYIEGVGLSKEKFDRHPLVIEYKFQKALEEELLDGQCG